MKEITQADLRRIRLVATDMDGTLTIAGKFTSDLLRSLEQLSTAGIEILIVTGRSAGWVNGLANYLPIGGAIAENGGLFYTKGEQILLTPISDLKQHRQELSKMFAVLKTQFPQIQESEDNPFRITDWTFDVFGLSDSELEQMNLLCQSHGWNFTYSNVQCHILPANQNKAIGLLKVLKNNYPNYSVDQVVTVGDSPNDESLFNPERFPISIGVANVHHYTDQLQFLPTYITCASEGIGFCELVTHLIESVTF